MRVGFINVDIGDRDSGKTFEKIHNTIPNSIKKCLVVGTYDHPAYRDAGIKIIPSSRLQHWTSGNARIVLDAENPMKDFLIICEHIRNTTIICEDVAEYTDADIYGSFRQMLGMSKNVYNDIYLQYWSFSDVQPKVYRMMNVVTIFRTSDRPEDAINKMKESRFLKIKPIFEKVRSLALEANKKKLPPGDPRRYPHFSIPINLNVPASYYQK